MMSIRSLSLIVMLLSAATVTTGEEFEIGSKGAAIELDASWERRTIDPNLGPDQFVSMRGFWCLVTEFEGLIDGREDLDRLLETVINGLPPSIEVLEHGPTVLRDRVHDADWVTRRLVVRISGLKIAYQFDAVGRDGLAYLIMTWSMASNETDLQDWASRIARSLSMPPPDSDWGTATVAAPQQFRFGHDVLELTFRHSLLMVEDPETDTDLRTLWTADAELAVHFGLVEHSGRLDGYLDDVVRYLDEGSTSATENERLDVLTPVGRGRQSRTDFIDEDGTSYVILMAAVPVADELVLDLRMVATTTAWCEERERHWEQLVSTVAFSGGPDVDAFPKAVEAVADREALNGPAAAIVAGSALVAEADGWGVSFFEGPDGRVYVHDGDRIVAADPSAVDEDVLVEISGWMPNRVLEWWAGRPLTVDADGHVAAIENRELVALDVTADRFAVIDDDRLLLVPRREAPEVFGFEGLPVVEASTLVEYTRGGASRTITSLGHRGVDHLCVTPDGRKALLALRPLTGHGSAARPQGTDLVFVDLESGDRHRVATWKTVTRIAASVEFWLVSGSPLESPSGLYLVAADGGSELLISGDVEGLSLDGETLRFAANLYLASPDASIPSNAVYEGPLALIREHGSRCRPFTVETLNLIADQIGETRADLGTIDGWLDYLEMAETTSRRVTGVGLPSSGSAVDQLLSDLSYESELEPDAVALLTALLIRALSDAGASWVDGEAAAGVLQPWDNGWVGDTLYLVALQPQRVVASTLFSEEGWWQPVSSIVSAAAGREIVLGFDVEALEGGLDDEAAGRPEMLEILELKDKKIGRLFQQYPTNSYLRDRVYRQLAAHSRFAGMERLADAVIRDGETSACDWQAWAAARNRDGVADGDGELDIERLREAVGRYPHDAELVLLLGRAYELSGRPERADLARACFLKVAELRSWGELVDQAEAALLRLDDGEPAP
jgi:hypothetical protein